MFVNFFFTTHVFYSNHYRKKYELKRNPLFALTPVLKGPLLCPELRNVKNGFQDSGPPWTVLVMGPNNANEMMQY